MLKGYQDLLFLLSLLAGLVILSVFDIFWNAWNSKLESKYPYKILAIYQHQELLDAFLDEFEDYVIYDIAAVSIEEYTEQYAFDNVHIVVVL